MDYEISERMSTVEAALAEFIIQTNKMFRKGELETMALREEMKAFKDEMKEFKDEMKGFQNRMENITRDMNQKWGELANKLGTFAEDIAAPNLPRIARELFDCPIIEHKAINVDRIDPNTSEFAEFDAVAGGNGKIFLLETKSTIRMKYINSLPELIERFKRCFPEYAGKQLIPIFASMKINDNVVKQLSKLGFYAMVMGERTMDVVNFKEVKKSIIL